MLNFQGEAEGTAERLRQAQVELLQLEREMDSTQQQSRSALVSDQPVGPSIILPKMLTHSPVVAHLYCPVKSS